MLLKTPITLLTLVVLFASQVIFSQDNDDGYIPRPFEEKDVFIDIYTGYPNWGTYFLEEYIEDNEYELKQIKGVPHIGGRLEFIISKEFGFTVDALYDSWGGSWSNMGLVEDTSGFMITQQVENSFQVNRLRVQIGITYHLDEITVEDLDLYAGAGIGSNKLWVTDEVEDANIDLKERSYFQPEGALINSPISVRARVGGRYFFTDKFALNLEISLGGPLITGGLSFLL